MNFFGNVSRTLCNKLQYIVLFLLDLNSCLSCVFFFNVLWYENIFNFIYLVKKYLHFNFFLSFLMLFVTAVDFPLFLLLENESVPFLIFVCSSVWNCWLNILPSTLEYMFVVCFMENILFVFSRNLKLQFRFDLIHALFKLFIEFKCQ